MDLLLAGRVAVVTGGTSGIGLATVRRFLTEGAYVAFCARDAERVAATADTLRAEFGDRVIGVAADILDAAAMTAFADAASGWTGRVDALVHNAGQSRMQALETLVDADWSQELELKFFGLLRPTRAFLPLLRSAGGAIVYVSSLLAKQPETRLIATSAARGGALNLAKALSIEFAPAGVRFNSILLGVIDTGQWEKRWNERVAAGESIAREDYDAQLARDRHIPLGRIGRPQEVADTIVFLASPLCGYTTGAVVEISGGLSRYV